MAKEYRFMVVMGDTTDPSVLPGAFNKAAALGTIARMGEEGYVLETVQDFKQFYWLTFGRERPAPAYTIGSGSTKGHHPINPNNWTYLTASPTGLIEHE